MRIEQFLVKIKEVADIFKKLGSSRIVLLHHNDTDGLTSGAILSAAIERLGLQHFRYTLEKPYPEVVSLILNDDSLPADTVFLITDFGSGMLRRISEINSGRFKIFVLDHHSIEQVDDKSIHLINCLDYQIPGSSHCTSSSITFLFAHALNEGNRDLAWLGVLGAFGDHHYDSDGKLEGVNQLVLSRYASDYVALNKKGKYEIQLQDGSFLAEDIVEWINSLGSFGYLKGGPDIAIKGLRERFDLKYRQFAERYKMEFIECYNEWIKNPGIQSQSEIAWFILPDTFLKFGVKSVGLVCEKLISDNKVSQDMYLAGFQVIPDLIPGLGNIKLNQSKVSMRIPPALLSKVRNRERLPLPDILPQATKNIGGFSDGCHLHAGASTVRIGDEKKLINEMAQIIKNNLS